MIKSIKINNFRNIKNITISFSSKSNIILGKNAQGKTSILEAIFFFSIGKAYRSKNYVESINFKNDFSILEAEIQENNLFVAFQKKPRKKINFKIDESNKKLLDFLGNFTAVFFSPEDLKILSGGPGERRDFLDYLLFRIDKNYIYLLKEYQKVLKNRNILLKNFKDGKSKKEDFAFWDEKLVQNGIQIIKKRENLLKEIIEILNTFYQKISNGNEKIKLEYLKNIESDEKIFLKKLEEKFELNVLLGNTTVGPHRDDVLFFINGNEVKNFASQGENRSFVLALKYCEIEILKKNKKKNITLLLDDVFSELDEKRQKSLIKLSENYQTIISSTSIPKNIKIEKVFEVENGEIISL